MLIVLDHQALRTLSPAELGAAKMVQASTASSPTQAEKSPRQRRVVVIGNFDGVHRGHQELFTQARALLRSLAPDRPEGADAGQVVALTFWPHPTRVLAPAVAPPLITSRQRRRELLADCGVDVLIEQPFDLRFAALSPTQFVSELLQDSLQADAVCVGYDFNFGKGRSGNAETLAALLSDVGIRGLVVPAFAVPALDEVAAGAAPLPESPTTICSSTGIRKAVQGGKLAQAERLLGRPVELEGVVEHGAARGRQLGFPTANLRPDAELTPAVGIYAAWVEILGPMPAEAVSTSGARALFYRPVLARHPAAVSVGYNATFTARSTAAPADAASSEGAAARESHRGGGQAATWPQLSIEAHVIQPAGAAWLDLYGQTLRLTLVARLRDEERFASVDALRAQIAADVAATRKLLGVTG